MADLFLKLLNASISASYLVAAVVLLRLALKKAPKWVFPMLWGMVALRLLFPISIESALSLQPSAQPIPPDIAMAPHPAINSGIPMVNQAVNPIIAEAFAPSPTASANPLQIWLWVGGWVWLAGMMVMLLYTLITYLRLRRRVSTAVPVGERICQGETVASPFVLGLIRPRIYLPVGLDEKERSYIVAHEQAHIRRKDHLWKPLGFALLAVHWFNPIMWLAYILLCRDIELACDEKVIKQLGREGRADYSQALLRCSVSRRSIAACPLAFGEVGVKQRVKSVLSYKKPAFWIIAAAVISSAVLAVCFLTDPKEEKRPDVQPGEYHSQEILYSTVGIILDNKIVQDLFDCQIREDHQLLIQPCTDEDGAEENWHIIGRLAKCQLTNEMLSDLIYLPNNWLADVQDDNGSLDIGAITDAWAATLGRYGETALDLTVPGSARDAFLVFSTDRDETYLAQCSVLGDGGEYPYINYITYLARLGPRPAKDDRPTLDAADWGIRLQVEQASPTGTTVVFNQLTSSAGFEYVGGNDYLLQRKADGAWEDVPRLQEPTFAKDGYTVSAVRRHEIDWSWLYGELPGGNYRIGKALTRRSFVYPDEQIPEERAIAWGEFTIGSPEDVILSIQSPYLDDPPQNVEDFIRRQESLVTDGVRPLSELPANYNPEDAAMDGCLVTRAGELWSGGEQFRAFAEAADRKEKAFLRIMNDVPSSLTERCAAVYDLHFDGSRYELRWLEDGREKSAFFRCLNHYEGQREASTNVLEAYEYYALTNDPNASLARIEIPGVYPQDHFTVYGVHAIRPKRPALPEKPSSADLKIGGEILLTVTDPAKLEQLSSLFSQTEVLGYEPRNHSLDPGLELIVWGDDGARIAIGLDRDGEICCIDGKFSCYYSGDGSGYLPRLWDCLGIEGWPDELELSEE